MSKLWGCKLLTSTMVHNSFSHPKTHEGDSLEPTGHICMVFPVKFPSSSHLLLLKTLVKRPLSEDILSGFLRLWGKKAQKMSLASLPASFQHTQSQLTGVGRTQLQECSQRSLRISHLCTEAFQAGCSWHPSITTQRDLRTMWMTSPAALSNAVVLQLSASP